MEDAYYIEHRLDDQIKWYDKKSTSCQYKYKALKWIGILLALSIPPIGAYYNDIPMYKFIVSCIGFGIAVVEFGVSMGKYHEHWIEYRTTSELLKHEKYLYQANAGGYAASAQPFQSLVERCESIISSENIDWAQLHRAEMASSSNTGS